MGEGGEERGMGEKMEVCANAAAMGVKLAGDSYISTNPYLLVQVFGGVFGGGGGGGGDGGG